MQGHLRRSVVVYLNITVVENLDIESQTVNYVIGIVSSVGRRAIWPRCAEALKPHSK